MELCSHLAESFYLVILLKTSVKTAGFWPHDEGTGIPSLAAATSRQLTELCSSREFGFCVLKWISLGLILSCASVFLGYVLECRKN